MKLLTKVAKGVAFGDVSNQAVRNILTELSKTIYGGITEQEMEDTMEIGFGWKCPYTGRDLKASGLAKDGTYATDHIYPQNRDWCGLNVKGNLVIVDKKANNAKGAMDVDTFMKTDSEFWDDLGIDLPTRLKRLQLIKDFQKDCGYDPDKICSEVSSLLKAHYDHIRDEQEKCIENALLSLDKSGIHVLTKTISSSTTKSTISKTKKKASLPELVFYPADEQLFKTELVKSKKAHFVLTYASGKKVTTPWSAFSFDSDSNLRGNIQSRPFWRNKTKEGLIKVEVFID